MDGRVLAHQRLARVRRLYGVAHPHLAQPRSTDTTRGATESHTPDRQVFLHSSLDLPAHLRLDGRFRAISHIANQQVPAYAELNAQLTWQPTATLDLSIVGQHLLHRRHAEFGALAMRRDIERGVYGLIEWRF